LAASEWRGGDEDDETGRDVNRDESEHSGHTSPTDLLASEARAAMLFSPVMAREGKVAGPVMWR